jgi:2-C-methyl-D-erythritol 2,4-cyclodiphosphate synthase
MSYRIGFGIDFHPLAESREFWLGGVRIPSDRGAVGHSDADVLIHAICDALLGALNLGDIGVHFPNTDAAYKDIDSKILLARS